MKKPTFFEGVLVAVAVSVAGAALLTALTFVFPLDTVLRVVVAGIGLSYVLYLLRRSRERVGRIVVLMLWAAGCSGREGKRRTERRICYGA